MFGIVCELGAAGKVDPDCQPPCVRMPQVTCTTLKSCSCVAHGAQMAAWRHVGALIGW
jgi:hypothetical protein